MWLQRRKGLARLVVAALAVLGAVVLWEGLADRAPRYRPGQATEGLVDALARGLPEDRPAVRFTDVAAELGLVFRHFPAARTGRLPEDMGSGVALGDYDGDGWTDVFLVNAAGPLAGPDAGPDTDAEDGADRGGRSRLFRNLAGARFEDVTDASGLEVAGLGMAAAFADVDSDGDLDLFVTSYGGCRLFRNAGGRFEDVTEGSGVESALGFWTGIAVGDYDADGALDLYVCGYVRYDETIGGGSAAQYETDIPALLNPSSFEPERNLLFRGRGDGTFEERAEAAGVANRSGRSLGALFCDLNGDGRPDVYVANDVSDNALFLNRGDGTFEDCTVAAFLGDYRGAMGLAAADFDDDMDLDVFITHWIAQENALYACRPDAAAPGELVVPAYRDEADRVGLGHVGLDRVGWATRFFDYDLDGRLDLFVVNGGTIPVRGDPLRLVPQRMQLFWNAGPARGFFEVGAAAGDVFREEAVGRGGATFDFDLDGDEDLVVVRHGAAAWLLRNEAGADNGALRVRLRQPASAAGGRFALGARVLVATDAGRRIDVVGTQGSYLSQHAVGELAFGLGRARRVAALQVTWPDGETARWEDLPADVLVHWERGASPRIEPLPGKLAERARGPAGADGQRRFFAVLQRASAGRIAGRHAEAAADYRAALELWPGHQDALYYLGHCLEALDDGAGALAVFERMVALHPRSNRGWMQVGLLRLADGDPTAAGLAAAQAAFERCHAINGEESRPVIQLGIVALLKGELERAERLFADAALLNHRSIEARYFGGEVAWRRGDAARARELLDQAHALARSSAERAGASASNEGDTRAGASMLAPRKGSSRLERWRSLAERQPDPEREYERPAGR